MSISDKIEQELSMGNKVRSALIGCCGWVKYRIQNTNLFVIKHPRGSGSTSFECWDDICLKRNQDGVLMITHTDEVWNNL